MRTSSESRAPVLEAFASVQGEGRYVGQPQVFLRLAGCPLRCRWCDTPASLVVKDGARARIAAPDGTRREPAVVDAAHAIGWVDELDPTRRMPLSLTGGEPLARPDFVLALAERLGGRRLHLESAGAHPRALERVREVCDHLSLDLKCPADLDAPVELSGAPSEPAPRDDAEWAEARRATLALATGRDAALKLVVAGGRAPADHAPLLADAREHAPDLLVVVQPATPANGVDAPDRSVLEAVLADAHALGLEARLLPQLHRVLGLP